MVLQFQDFIEFERQFHKKKKKKKFWEKKEMNKINEFWGKMKEKKRRRLI